MSNPRCVSLLGSTGSIGRSTLAVARHYPGLIEFDVLGANANIAQLVEQAREFKPRALAVSDEAAAKRLAEYNLGLPIYTGESGLIEAAQRPVDIVLCAVVGAVGLKPLLAAIDAGNDVAVANKEPFVMAGKLVMERAAAKGVNVLPVDSEHNAIFQCLAGNRREDVLCIHLTASGGPFYGRTRDSLRNVLPEEATKHPTWDMGAKISVDSATLMNKGLEIVEAMWLFGLPESKIEVVIHPQSIVHSLVEFNDGHILAHLGVTNMMFPILFALTWPDRVATPMARLDLTKMRDLSFAAPDFREFPCLGLARAAAAHGGTAPAILNAANEVAVDAFCRRRLPFLSIAEVVAHVMDTFPAKIDYTLDEVLEVDAQARAIARKHIECCC